MKRKYTVLFISAHQEDIEIFARLFSCHFSSVNFVGLLSPNDLDEVARAFSDYDQITIAIIDTTMKNQDIDQLFQLATREMANYPILFFGNEVMLKDRVPDNIYDYNLASGLIIRPVAVNDLISSVTRAIEWVNNKERKINTLDLSAENFVPIKVKNFRNIEVAPVELYFQITPTKYLKAFGAGVEITQADIIKYLGKGVKYFYAQKVDETKLLSISAQNLQNILSKPGLSGEFLFAAQIQAMSTIHDYIQKIGVTEELINLVSILIDSVDFHLRFHLGELQMLVTLYPWNDMGKAEHSLLTMYLSNQILIKIGWHSETSKKKLGLAGILQDLYVKGEQDHLLEAPSKDDFPHKSEKYLEEYLNHPHVAVETANLFPGLGDIGFILAQHHERPSGKGFPKKLNSAQITTMSCIFIVANTLASRLTVGYIRKIKISAIVNTIMIDFSEGNFRSPLKALKASIAQVKW